MTWVDANSSYFALTGSTSWVADVGAYLLVDEPDPPPVRPTGYFEIDFYTGFPNPDTNPAHFADGSYSTAVTDGWRYFDGTTEHTGTSPAGVTVAAGVHLFVAIYTDPSDTTTPTVDPLSLVPSNYVTGGGLPPVVDPNAPPEGPSAFLYGPRGQTLAGRIHTATVIQWQDELSKGGSGSITVPMTDGLAASIGDRAVIKFGLHGAIRYGIQVRSERTQQAVDGTRMLVIDNQPGLFATLNDATVFPEWGLTRTSQADRYFGYMSQSLGWYVGADWAHAVGTVWNTSLNSHGAYPKDFRAGDPTAQWITAPSLTSADTTAPDWQVIYGRGACTVTTATDVEILFAADNAGELWHNGDCVVQWQRMDFRQAQRVKLTLDAGTHLFAVKAQNHPQPAAYSGDPNPVAFIFSMYPVDRNGNKSGSVILRSDTNWVINDNTHSPGWHRGQILRLLFDEAVNRSVWSSGPLLTRTFSETLDSNGAAWSDTPVVMSFPVYQMGLADVASQLAETGIDVWVDAATMTLNAYNRKGTDLTGTVEFKTGSDGGTLLDYETTKTNGRFTAVGVHEANGTFREVTDSGGFAAIGRIEVGVSAGTRQDESADQIARSMLAESAGDQITATAEGSTVGAGPQPYSDYSTGDTVKAPGHRGVGTIKMRAMSITVDGSTYPWRAWPDSLVEDKSV